MTGEEIESLQKNEKIFRENTEDKEPLEDIRTNGKVMYDLRLGPEAYLSTRATPITLSEQNPYLVIKPGEFALLTTMEYVTMPKNVLGFISLRFTWASKGLINISGFHVDPGYEGILIFSVYNAGSNEVFLRLKEAVFMIFFSRLEKPVSKGYGKKYTTIPAEMITSVRGVPLSLRNLDNRVRTLETRFTVVLGLLGTFVGTLIVFLLTRVLK